MCGELCMGRMYLEYSMVYSPLPWVSERSIALNPNMLFRGT